MIAISSVGADAMAKNFYLKVKGETEQLLGKIGLQRLDVIRPGLLRGPREELRPAERLGMIISPLIDLVLHGEYRRYRSVHAETVVDAILGLIREKMAGRFVFEHDGILRAARRGQVVLQALTPE